MISKAKSVEDCFHIVQKHLASSEDKKNSFGISKFAEYKHTSLNNTESNLTTECLYSFNTSAEAVIEKYLLWGRLKRFNK